MSTYLRMWELIKEATPEQRKEYLDTYSPAKGRDIPFKGELFFDVDLLEALRNASEMPGHERTKLYRQRTMIYQVTDNSKLFTEMAIAMEKTFRDLECLPIWSRDEAIDKPQIPKHH